ncbi:MAG: rRNA processing protein Fcf1 [Amphiamblys sp. WSBS2006]|nr:MAG: rRNA processing protein Fcf1 [Amphiamblys sp. WSBS2006]
MPARKTAKVKKVAKRLPPQEARRPKENTEAPKPSHMYFSYNKALRPPYNILLDTNFISFALKEKIDLKKGMLDSLYASSVIHVTDCVIAELEKLGPKYRLALSIARSPEFVRLPCTHRGIYADDCIVERVSQHRCYVVATCDRALKKRLRIIEGVPIMYVGKHSFKVEQLPEGYGVMF